MPLESYENLQFQNTIGYFDSGTDKIDSKGALHLVNEKLPQLAPMITETSGNHLTIDLEKIEQAKVVTEKLRLSDIIIQEDALELTAELK